MGQRTSVYLDDDLHAAAKASGVPLAELIRHGLTAEPAAAATTTDRPVILPAGEPCPGAVCSGPGCWQRDTAAMASATWSGAQPAVQPSRTHLPA